MSENKYDSELIGWADEPKRDESGNIRSWKVCLSATHLEDLKQFKTQKGYVYLTLFTSKAGKPMCSVYNPNSEAAQTQPKASQAATVENDLPF